MKNKMEFKIHKASINNLNNKISVIIQGNRINQFSKQRKDELVNQNICPK